MKRTDRTAFSRREFAKRAALGTAAAVSGPSALFESLRVSERTPGDVAQLAPEASKLSPQSRAEAEARYQAIVTLYPDRFSEAQKADLKHACYVSQEGLDHVRAYTVSNGEQPALYLKPLVEREKTTNAPPNMKLAPSPAKSAPPSKPSANAETSDKWRVASGEKKQKSQKDAAECGTHQSGEITGERTSSIAEKG